MTYADVALGITLGAFLVALLILGLRELRGLHRRIDELSDRTSRIEGRLNGPGRRRR